MNLAELKSALDAAGVSERAYSLASRDPGEVYRIAPIHDHLGDGWEVYYSERGNKNDLLLFRSESEACADLLRRVLRDPTTRAAGRLHGQQGSRGEPPMTPRREGARAQLRNLPETFHIPLVIAVVLFLIIHFVAVPFVWMGVRAINALRSPAVTTPARPAPKLDPATTLRLEVSADGVVHIDHQPLEDSAIGRVIHERQPEKVLLAADRAVHYERLKDLIANLKAAGVEKITFSVVDHDSEPSRQSRTPNLRRAS